MHSTVWQMLMQLEARSEYIIMDLKHQSSYEVQKKDSIVDEQCATNAYFSEKWTRLLTSSANWETETVE